MEKITEREWETQRERFSRATYDEVLRIGKNDLIRVPAALHMKAGQMDPKDVFKTVVLVTVAAGSAGAANGRSVNDAERKLFTDLLQALFVGFPPEKADAFAAGMATPFAVQSAPKMKELMMSGGIGLAPILLDLALCFAYADGAADEADLASLRVLLDLVNECLAGQNV